MSETDRRCKMLERERRELKNHLRVKQQEFARLRDQTTDNIGRAEYHRAWTELGGVLVFIRYQAKQRRKRASR